jgi:hypothetical protein
MADQIFMFATTAGFMVGLGVLLFVVRSRRPKEAKVISGAGSSSSSSSTGSSSYGEESRKGKRIKRYNSDGTPVYE